MHEPPFAVQALKGCLTARLGAKREDLLRQMCMHYCQSIPFTTVRRFTRMLCSRYPLRRFKHMKNKSATVHWVPVFAAIVPCMFLRSQKRISSGARIQQGKGTHHSCAILGPAFVMFSARPGHSRNSLLQNWRLRRRCLGLLEQEDLRPAYIVVLLWATPRLALGIPAHAPGSIALP